MSSLGWALIGGSLQLEFLHKRHQHPILQLRGISTSYQSLKYFQKISSSRRFNPRGFKKSIDSGSKFINLGTLVRWTSRRIEGSSNKRDHWTWLCGGYEV